MSGTVVFAIVQKGKAKEVFSKAKEAGSNGGTVFFAKGTAPSSFLSILGLADSRKELIITLCDETAWEKVFDAMATVPRVQGVVFSIDCKKSYLQKKLTEREEVSMDGKWEMINVICNQGYGEEVMAAARKAGAGGGTVMNGRGTGTPDDVKFFGIPLVPEKEMLMILVAEERLDEVFQAIVSLPCLQETGSGIVYTMPVTRFQVMGKKE
jgi:nitrogen regulatory protein PII